MKKYLIGSIVGGIIIFLWQGLSWMALGIHSDSMMHNAGQENTCPRYQQISTGPISI